VESYSNDGTGQGPSLASANGYSGQAGRVSGSASQSGTSTYNPQLYLDVYYAINAHGDIVSSGQALPSNFEAALQEAQS